MQIEIDFDVFKAITAMRVTESVTANDVLRQLLGLGAVREQRVPTPAHEEKPAALTVKGVSFPHGTEFRATYKQRIHTGVVQDGTLIVNGNAFRSPSAAGKAITGSNVNGWNFWKCRIPGTSTWTQLRDLR
jgi:hypothetical protein